MVRLSTLGRLRLEGSPFRQAKPLLLLAYLAVEGRQSRRRMAELVWPGGNSLKSLSMAMTRLRAAVPGCCEADATHVWAAAGSDASALESAIAAMEVDTCLALYQGPFLDGVRSVDVSSELEEWIVETRERLAARLRSVMLQGAERLNAGGKLDDAGALAASAVRLAGLPPAEPAELRRLHALLVAARHPLALEVRDELRELEPLTVSEALIPTVDATNRASGHLHLPSNTFIGRERELALLAAQFATPGSRLITILGPGGSGKTRLALEASAAAARWGEFPGGVYTVMLESLTDVHQLPSVLCRTLTGAAPHEDQWRRVADIIGQRRVLLVLDNMEHLRSVAPRLADLVAATADLKLLVTSRERLGVAEEHVLSLAGLAFDEVPGRSEGPGRSAAFELLTERALRTRIELDVDRHSRALSEICRLVEGLPLGLELAAGMLRLMPPEELAALIEADPGMLGEQTGDASGRHGTLRTTAAASWLQLPADLREALARLSVFVGGFRRTAAAEATQVTSEQVAELIDRSWLRLTADGRLGSHPYLHAYARERLADTPDLESITRDAHAAWFAGFAGTAAARLRGPEQVDAFASLAEEHDNLAAALAHLSVGDKRAALELAVTLCHYWGVRGHHVTGRAIVLALLESVDSDDRLIAAAWSSAGHLATRASDYRAGRTYFEKALALAEANADHNLQAEALLGVGATLAQGHGDYIGARERYQAGLWHASQVDDYRSSCDALRYLGAVHVAQGHYLQGRACYEEALALAEQVGDAHAAAKVSINLSTALSYLGEHARAKLLNQRSLATMRSAGDLYGVAVLLINLAIEASNDDDIDTSLAYYQESLALFRRLGDRTSASQVLNNLANVNLRVNRPREAQRLLEESLDTLRNTGDVEQTAYALFLYGKALLDLGDRQGARQRLDACIETCRASDDNWALMRALLVLARWHAEGDEVPHANRALREAEQLAHAAGDKNTLAEAERMRLALQSVPRS